LPDLTDEEVKKTKQNNLIIVEDFGSEIDNEFFKFETQTINNISISLHDIRTLSPKQWFEYSYQLV
jgi:hypothetical protein